MKKFLYLLIALLLLSVSLCSCGGTAYSKAIEAAIQMTYYGDEEYIEFAVPEEYFEWYEDRYEEDFEDYLDDWDDEQWIEKSGEDYEVTYEVSNEEKVDKDTLEDIKDCLEDKYDIEPSDVKKAYKFDIEYTIEGSEGKDSSDWEDLYGVKIRKNWYIVVFDGDYIDFCYDAW